MFVYTVYPTVPHKPKKKSIRQVEPVLRVRPVNRVEYNSDPIPSQQTYDKTKTKDTSRIYSEQNNWKRPTGEFYIDDALPLLLGWRRPKTVVSPDYIQKHIDQLHTIQSKHSHYQ